jgi:sec1 family domain-containing protein 1
LLTRTRNILAALLQGIKTRHLDDFFQLEENIMKQGKSQVLETIKEKQKAKSDPLDILRFFVIWYLSTDQDVSGFLHRGITTQF